MVAVAALLSRIVLDRPFLNLPPQRLLPWGLLLALLTGVVPLVFGQAFLKSAYGYLTWPLIGEFEWATAVLFDAGVFLVVVGTTLTIIELLAEDTDTTLSRLDSAGGLLMELLLPLLAALLVGTGVFLVLSRAMIRLIIGLSMIAYGANLSILLVAGGRLSDPPLTNLRRPLRRPAAASSYP